MTNWQPIETAPQDGTDLLLFDGEHMVGRWQEDWMQGWVDRRGRQVSPLYWMPLTCHTATNGDKDATWDDILLALDSATAQAAAMREALEKIYNLPGELNLADYNEDDVRELNENFVAAILTAEQALANSVREAGE